MQSRLYYGWVILLAISLTETISWGILYYAFTVFLKPMQAELGWSRAEMSGAFSLALILSGLVAYPVGRWLDKHGARLLMTAGSVAASLLLVAWAGVNNLFFFYLIWAGLGLTLAAVLYDPAFAIVAVWFHRKRNRALTLLTFLAGFASVIFIPLTDWLVSTQGWRQALLILAGLLAFITIPLHALVLRRRPEDLRLAPDGLVMRPVEGQVSSLPTTLANKTAGKVTTAAAPPERSITTRQALRGAPFWWLTLAFSANMLLSLAISVHLVPYLSDRSFDSGFAASAAGLIGVMALPGRLVFNLMGERLPRSLLTSFIFFLQTIGLLVLLVVPDTLGVWLFVVFYGVGFGAITPMRAGMVAQLYGRRHFASINGVLSLFTTLARGISPICVGLAHDLSGSYTPVYWTLVAVSILAALAIPMVEKSASSLPR